MKLLLIILAVMTWTVATKSSVQGSGESPSGMAASYACTYQKGDVRKGDTATLSLTKLGGISVEKIEVYVKSNKSAGAGTFWVTINGQRFKSKSGTFKSWTGKYDNATYHAISLVTRTYTNVNELVVELVGTTSSLHIEKYVITWSPRPAHSVTLMRCGTVFDVLTETTGGQGVTLPHLSDTLGWRFAGWTETEILATGDKPTLALANSKYYPLENCTLWATYQYEDTPEQAYVTDLQSGVYQYVNRTAGIALTGVPKSGRMDIGVIDDDDEGQYYSITFAGQDTAYITHEATGRPIGYNESNMAAEALPWLVYHKNDETVFYTIYKNDTYVLWLNILDQVNGYFYAGLAPADIGSSPLALRIPQQTSSAIYSSRPETQGLEDVTTEGVNEWVLMRFGNVELVLKDGKKYLRVKE